MAIFVCPECGKSDVSDKADICPNCGFGIAEYVKFINTKEADKKEAIRKIMANNYTKEDVERLVKENNPLPWLFYLFALPGLACFASIIIFGNFTFIFFMLFFFGIAFMFYRATEESRAIHRAYLYKVERVEIENIEERRRVMLEETERYYDDPEGYDKQYLRNAKMAVMPRCPLCKSKNIGRISTAGRIVSVSIMGLASNTIGKNLVCRDCKHTW